MLKSLLSFCLLISQPHKGDSYALTAPHARGEASSCITRTKVGYFSREGEVIPLAEAPEDCCVLLQVNWLTWRRTQQCL